MPLLQELLILSDALQSSIATTMESSGCSQRAEKKFIGLEKNENVCLAIYDKYEGFGNLKSLQVMGKAELIEPFSDAYNRHAEIKKIPLSALEKLESPMHLICVTPIKIEVLFSDLKKDGYSSRQRLYLQN